MEPTIPRTDSRLPRHHHYPAMTGEERLEALRAIRGMWKGQGTRSCSALRPDGKTAEFLLRKTKPDVCPRYQCHYLLHR
jgi:hypothetical protein